MLLVHVSQVNHLEEFLVAVFFAKGGAAETHTIWLSTRHSAAHATVCINLGQASRLLSHTFCKAFLSLIRLIFFLRFKLTETIYFLLIDRD